MHILILKLICAFQASFLRKQAHIYFLHARTFPYIKLIQRFFNYYIKAVKLKLILGNKEKLRRKRGHFERVVGAKVSHIVTFQIRISTRNEFNFK